VRAGIRARLVLAAAIHAATAGAGETMRRIGNDGAALAPGAPFGSRADEWACPRDEANRLTWEIKTHDGGPRDRRSTYTPYDDSPATNGGHAGYRDQTSGDCVRAAMPARSCNTRAHVEMVNASASCGFRDWRLPTAAEFTALAARTSTAAQDDRSDVLPNIAEGWYWSGVLRTVAVSRVVLLPPAARPQFYDGSYRVVLVRGRPRPSIVPRIAEAKSATPHSTPTSEDSSRDLIPVLPKVDLPSGE